MIQMAQTYNNLPHEGGLNGRLNKLATRIAERAKMDVVGMTTRDEYGVLKKGNARLGMFDNQSYSVFAEPGKTTIRIKPAVPCTRGTNAMNLFVSALQSAFVSCWRGDRVQVDADSHRITITILHKSQLKKDSF